VPRLSRDGQRAVIPAGPLDSAPAFSRLPASSASPARHGAATG
jgi:hypothetical protein